MLDVNHGRVVPRVLLLKIVRPQAPVPMLSADGPLQRENEVVTGPGQGNHLLHFLLFRKVQKDHEMEIAVPCMAVDACLHLEPLEKVPKARDVSGKSTGVDG